MPVLRNRMQDREESPNVGGERKRIRGVAVTVTVTVTVTVAVAVTVAVSVVAMGRWWWRLP